MGLFCQRNGRWFLGIWILNAVVLAEGEAPTATLTRSGSMEGVQRSYVHFVCKVTGSPKPTVTWYKDGGILTNSRTQRYTLSDGGLLRVGSLIPRRHDGDYSCKASNDDGSVSSQAVTLKVYSARRTPSGFPRIAKHPSSVVKSSGEDATFECVATGNPSPVISWMKNFVPVDFTDSKVSIPKPGSLMITDVSSLDAGRFECVANSSMGMVYSRIVRLRVQETLWGPRITRPPRPVTVDPETLVYLNCSATGNPQPSVVWELEGTRLVGSADGVLTIPSIQRSGNYTCVADSVKGRVRAYAFVTVRKLPFAPTRPTATQITHSLISVTWQPGGGPPVKSYTLNYRFKGDGQWKVINNIRGRMSKTIVNLQPFTSYQFRVFALNEVGTSKPSPLAEFTTSQKAPGTPPHNIQSKGTSDTSFEATWLPPIQPNGQISGYRLYYTTDLTQDMITWRFAASATNQSSVDGLQKKKTYFFRLQAYNSIGQGPLSDLFAVKTAKGVPGQPRSVRVTVLSSTSIQVTWEPPQYSGGGIFGYAIYYNKSSTDVDTNIDVVDSLGKEIMGLRPYSFYQVQVAAKSDKGVGPMSFAVVVQTLEDAPSDAPLNIRGKGVDSTSLEIRWDPPEAEHRNGLIIHYTIKYKQKGERARFVTVDGVKTFMILHNLNKYTTYYVWVSASTTVGEGPLSAKHTFSTAEDVPSGAPRQLKCKVVNASSINASWSAPLEAQQDGQIQGYMVFYLKVDDQGNQLVHGDAIGEMKDSESADNLAVALTDLEAETNYRIEVAAYTRKGDGARSAPVFAKTMAKLPDAPYVFTRAPSGSAVSIEWRTSVSGVLSYKLRYGKSLQRLRGREQASLKMKEMTFVPPTTKHQFQELDPGVWYLFKVSLRTTAGWSPEKPRWVEIPPGPPSGPPLQVRAYPVSSTSIRVTWLEPDEWERNGPLTGYSLVYNPLNRRGLSLVKNVTNPNQTRVVLTGLRMFAEYEIRVRALGLKGPGPLSRSVIERTLEHVPSPPRDLTATARSTTAVTVSWKSPQYPNGVVLGYIVLYSDDSTLPLNQWSIKSAKGYSSSLKALSRDTTYWIRVAAETSVGPGNYSLPVSTETLKYDLPETCRELKLDQANSQSVVLKWRPPETDAGITKYKVAYYGAKSYNEKGETKQLTHQDKETIDAFPGRQAYTLKGLNPHTSYQIEVSAVNSIGEGPTIKLNVKTDKGNPPPLQRPVIPEEELTDEYVPMEMEIASEKNGPISYYIVVVVPLGSSNKLPQDKTPDDYFKQVRRRREAKSNAEKPYIAAKFAPSQLPGTFYVGDESFKNLYGYHNKKLSTGSYYTMFTRAYVKSEKGDELYTSSPFVTPVKFGDVGDTAGGGASTGARVDPEEQKGGGLNLTFVIIPIVAVVVITAIVVIVFLVYKRKRRGKSKSTDDEKSEPSDPVELKRMTFQTPAMMDHPPIPVTELCKHIDNLKADNSTKFTQEYESIEPGQTFTTDTSTQEYNKPKNRYPNILALDHSRVRLATVEGITGSDYINANFCDGYRKENAYIATQGPIDYTIDDFWRMIWEQRTFTIVMLTNLEERGRVKCEQYWPIEGSELYGDIEVTVMDWVELANYAITTLQICKEGAPQAREVKHFQFTGWPDHGVPPHPTPFLAFLRRVRFYNPPDAGPIVAHCSAGVGRTACFIVIDSMLERNKHENTVDIYGHVTVLRTQRNFMVQTEEQYVFIHDALLEAVSCGNTEVHARSLLQHIKRLTVLGGGEGTGLEEEFRRLSNPSQAGKRRQGAGSLPINRSKNRLANILPYESTRVQLMSIRGSEGSDYINASFIDGYRQRWAYISTQGPLQDTVDDFWRMLMEQNSNIVVMLTQLHEGDRERCFKYWPDDKSARHGYYIVDPVSEQEFATFFIRDFKVKDARNDTVRNIKQFHFFGWPDSGVPNGGEGIVDLIGQVQKAYEQQDEEGPITVHCSDGVGRSGVFCTLSIVLERMRSEGVVDLFQTVKLLRTQRPNMIQSQEQYLFCYKTALEYLSSFDHYAV